MCIRDRGRAKRLLPSVTGELLTGLPDASLRVFQTSTFAEARLRCITAVEQADVYKRQRLFGTSSVFLERMGLTCLDELPPLAPHLPDASALEAELAGLAESGSAVDA